MEIETLDYTKLKSAFIAGKMDLSLDLAPLGQLTSSEKIEQYFLYSTYFLAYPAELKVTLGLEVNQTLLERIKNIQTSAYDYLKKHGKANEQIRTSSKLTVQEFNDIIYNNNLYNSYLEIYKIRDKVSKLLKDDVELNKFFADSNIEINNIDIQIGNNEVETVTYHHEQQNLPLWRRVYYFKDLDIDDEKETFINSFNDTAFTKLSKREQVLTPVKSAIMKLVKNSLIFYQPVFKLIKAVNGGAANKLKVDINIYFIKAMSHNPNTLPFIVEIKDTTGKITDTWASQPCITTKEVKFSRGADTGVVMWAGDWFWLTSYTYGKYFKYNTKSELLEIKKELLIKTAVDISRLQTKFPLEKYKELLTPYLDYIIQNIK